MAQNCLWVVYLWLPVSFQHGRSDSNFKNKKIVLGNVAPKSLDQHIRLAVVAAAPDFWLVRSEILNSTSRTALPTEKSQKWHNQTPGMSDLGMLVWWGWGGLPKNPKLKLREKGIQIGGPLPWIDFHFWQFPFGGWYTIQRVQAGSLWMPKTV